MQSAFTGIKTVSANKRYLFNAIPDTNHNANPTNPNRYSKGNPSEWRTVTEIPDDPEKFWTVGNPNTENTDKATQ